MPRHEELTQPPKLFAAEEMAQALERLNKDDYAEAIRIIVNTTLGEHLLGNEVDIQYAHQLLRPQLPKAARVHFEAGYRALVALHESSLTDCVERTQAFLDAYPGALQYQDSISGENGQVVTMRLLPPDKVHRAVRLAVFDDREEQLWLAGRERLQCDVTRFEPELRQALEPLLSPDETA